MRTVDEVLQSNIMECFSLRLSAIALSSKEAAGLNFVELQIFT